MKNMNEKKIQAGDRVRVEVMTSSGTMSYEYGIVKKPSFGWHGKPLVSKGEK